MDTFIVCVGKEEDGERQLVRIRVRAENPRDAREKVRAMGYDDIRYTVRKESEYD